MIGAERECVKLECITAKDTSAMIEPTEKDRYSHPGLREVAQPVAHGQRFHEYLDFICLMDQPRSLGSVPFSRHCVAHERST